MADSAITLNSNSSTGEAVDTRTNAAGEHRQVVIIGEGAAQSDAIVPASATAGLLTNPSDRAARDMGKIDIAAFDVALPSGSNLIGSVTIDSAGSIGVDDAGGSLTVDGSVAITGNIQLASSGTLSVTISSTGSTVAVSQYGTWTNTVTQGTGTNLHTVVDSGTVTISSTGSTVAASQYGTWNVGLNAGTNWLGTVALASSTSVSIASTGSTVAVSQYGVWDEVGINDSGNSITVDAPLATPVFVTPTPSTTGGWTGVLVDWLQIASIVTVKSSAGTLGGYYIYNPNSSAIYIQIWDVSGTVTAGATAPKFSFGIPATSAANLDISNGVAFANAIKVGATTVSSGSTGPTTPIVSNFWYK